MYKGQWANNVIHGQGYFTWPDGRFYKGAYQDDKKHGYGVFKLADGSRYEGQWLNGKQHGKGKFITKDGKLKKGTWENGKFVEWNNTERSSHISEVSNSQASSYRNTAKKK
jgi:hypothetical protein